MPVHLELANFPTPQAAFQEAARYKTNDNKVIALPNGRGVQVMPDDTEAVIAKRLQTAMAQSV